MSDNLVTIKGNLTDDPDLRFIGDAQTPVCTIRIASTRKFTDRSGKEREETTFINVNTWRKLAENVAESLRKGMRVNVEGRIRVRSYENQNGQTVWVTEVEAWDVAPSLLWATAQVTKNPRQGAPAPLPPDAPLSQDQLELPETF